MESLSSYARQFLGQMEKPDVESIEGLPPAISIDQKSTNRNPRSTVGTVTEIYDYFRLLYARVGTVHCPKCGKVIKKQTVDQMVDAIMQLPDRTKIQLLAPVVRGRKGTHAKLLEKAKKSGYVRVRIDGNMYELSEEIALEKNIKGGEKVLDVGCGSGILAIASLLLGAESATGVDIDELAVKTAEENGKMNGFGSDRLTFIHGDLADKVSGKFDIVVANIVADVIIMFCKTVPDFMADNAVFITSGIIDIREQEVVDAFAENGFEIIARHADGGWRCFECRRKK